MHPKFKPLKGDPVDFNQLDYTNTVASIKYDGIRALVIDGVVLSASLKPIPARHVQEKFRHLEFYDGELICGPANAEDVYNRTFSGVMTKGDGDPDVQFYAFDHTQHPMDEFYVRQSRLWAHKDVTLVQQFPVESEQGLRAVYEKILDDGFEGLMTRKQRGPGSYYKFGRSSALEGILNKMKPLEDFEARIVGYEEAQANNNEATINELGRTVRSSHKANKTGKGTLGKLVCDYGDGKTFKVGIFKGFKAADLQKLWNERESLPGQYVKLQKLAIGEKDLPRHPRVLAMLGLRSPLDM